MFEGLSDEFLSLEGDKDFGVVESLSVGGVLGSGPKPTIIGGGLFEKQGFSGVFVVLGGWCLGIPWTKKITENRLFHPNLADT